GSFAFTPSDKLAVLVNWLVGPEQNRNQMHDGINNRWIVDNTILYTGLDRWTFAVNFDFAAEEDDPVLVPTRQAANSRCGRVAGCGAAGGRSRRRGALPSECVGDQGGGRLTESVAPGASTRLREVPATIEHKIWKGLVGRLEYRRAQANRKAFSLQNVGGSGL